MTRSLFKMGVAVLAVGLLAACSGESGDPTEPADPTDSAATGDTSETTPDDGGSDVSGDHRGSHDVRGEGLSRP